MFGSRSSKIMAMVRDKDLQKVEVLQQQAEALPEVEMAHHKIDGLQKTKHIESGDVLIPEISAGRSELVEMPAIIQELVQLDAHDSILIMPRVAIESHIEIDDIPIIFPEDLENENSTAKDFVSLAEVPTQQLLQVGEVLLEKESSEERISSINREFLVKVRVETNRLIEVVGGA